MYKGYQSNNIYTDFPPIMNDGRSITSSYNPNAAQSEKIISENNLKTSFEYRNFLTKNANKIREHNYLESLNEFGYTITPADIIYNKPITEGAVNLEKRGPVFIDSSTPYTFSSVLDNKRQTRDVFSHDSDLKRSYLSREELNSKKVAPIWVGVPPPQHK